MKYYGKPHGAGYLRADIYMWEVKKSSIKVWMYACPFSDKGWVRCTSIGYLVEVTKAEVPIIY